MVIRGISLWESDVAGWKILYKWRLIAGKILEVTIMVEFQLICLINGGYVNGTIIGLNKNT